MGAWILIAAAAAPPAAAEAVAPPAAPPAAQAERGVIAYPPSFFAESKPISAYDMVLRVPGFTFDKGLVGVRGLAGASGNVLIDGQPPNSKNDPLDEILKRIPAASIERIELIRGGAPGIDTAAGYETPLFGGRALLNGAFINNPGYVEIYDHYRSTTGLEYEFDTNKKRQIELGGRFNRALNERIGLETTLFQQFSHQT